MKNNIIIIIAITFLVGSQGCKKDYLELEPKTSQMEANYYKTESDALFAIAAVYQTMAVHNGLEFVPITSDILSDDAFCGGSSASDMVQWHQIESSQMTAESATSSGQWSRCYSGIYRANILLSKLDQISWTDPNNKSRFEAEAKFCRAYFYWDLVRQFGWVPIFTTNLSSVDDYKGATQSTPEEVYKQIASDLLAAVKGLPASVSSAEKGRATKYAAQALLSRIYLYYQGFAKPVLGITNEWTDGTTTIDKSYVESALDSIILKGGYQLLTNYADVFSWENQNNAESIFELQYSEKGKCGDWSANYWNVYGNVAVIQYGIRDPQGDNTISTGWSFATLSWSLVNEYEAGDTRKDATVYDAGTKLTNYTKAYQNTGYFNKKYMPLKAYDATVGSRELNYGKDYIDIRLPDVLLMAAEVYLTDNPAKSLDYYNRVRTRAMGDAAAKTSITLDDIYHERRVEFGGEGIRYWDLLRRGLDYTQQKIQESINLPSGTTNAADFQDIKFNKNTYGMYPIPASEIRSTNSGVLKQYIPAFQ
ncbi:MAG TPA: RagB/SusD family nutrient uptake outer membrane protein [Bacteroidales bacterium]